MQLEYFSPVSGIAGNDGRSRFTGRQHGIGDRIGKFGSPQVGSIVALCFQGLETGNRFKDGLAFNPFESVMGPFRTTLDSFYEFFPRLYGRKLIRYLFKF